jgi:hypothetical protein
VVVGTGFTVPPDVAPLPPAMPWLDAAPAASAENETRVLEAFARIAAANRLPAIDRLRAMSAATSLTHCRWSRSDIASSRIHPLQIRQKRCQELFRSWQ